jgi:rhamnosyltransferase
MITVALPVRDGAATLDGVLAAVRAQRAACEVELLVCDSGSRDGSLEIARRHGARVLEIDPGSFAHGPTRNLLMEQARGEFVALLTQDAEPADEHWLEALLSGFQLADDVALVFGPYHPRAEAAPRTRRELERWFASLSPDGAPTVDRLDALERDRPALELFGRRTFFTDANACVRRVAWERVPFRPLRYAEDQALALDMLRAGYAKAFVPAAAVLHSHDYRPGQRFRRSFDEWRGLLEVYGWREPLSPRRIALQLRGELGAEWRELRAAGVPPARRLAILPGAAGHHVVRVAGALTGSRADRIPAWLRRRLSLEGRAEGPDLSER